MIWPKITNSINSKRLSTAVTLAFLQLFRSNKFSREIKPFEIVSFIKKPKNTQAGYPTVIFSHSISAKTRRRSKNRRLSLFLTVFGKILSPFYCRWFQRLVDILLHCSCLQIDPSNDFCQPKFFPAVTKSEIERLKAASWPSEI